MPRDLSPAPKAASYWLDDIEAAPDLAGNALPARVDVLVIGSGYTGLNAALQTARGGRSTLVIDAQAVGHGCSTRNGGQISTSIKPSLKRLAALYGPEKALAIRAEGRAQLKWIGDFIQAEGLECDFRRSGRYHAAHTPQHYEELAREAAELTREEGIETFAVPRGDQRSELGSDFYHGGVVFAGHCALHPAKYHRALLDLALRAGVTIVPECAASAIVRSDGGYRVTTSRGEVTARDVVVATNGYTTGLTPWLQRRVIPIGSNIIATEDLPAELMDELFPTDRIASDTCKVVYYYRPSPDRKKVIFGGRVAAREVGAVEAAPRLKEAMCRVFPQLEGRGLSHAWSGTVAYTFDEMAHVGQHQGVYHAMGYCGSGVSMASYLGMRTGQKVLGLAEGRTAFDDLPFPTRPFYTGRPWFLPAAIAWYRWLDDRQSKQAKRAA